MFYYFICDSCGFKHDVQRSIKEGPPIDELSCPNCSNMGLRHVLGGNFILKGNWPGKSIRERNARESTEKMIDESDVGQKEANEILTERRKGRKSWKEYQKHNNEKVKRVKKNREKGIRSTLPKKEYEI